MFFHDQITSVSIRNFTGRLSEDGKSLQMEEQPVTLRIYPPSDNGSLSELVKATVSDRKAVFELAQTTETNKEVPGVRNIPLDLGLLRSKQLTDIGDYKAFPSVKVFRITLPSPASFRGMRKKASSPPGCTRQRAPVTRKLIRSISFLC